MTSFMGETVIDRKMDTAIKAGPTSEIGKYAPTKANTSSSHGEPLGEKEMEGFLENLGWVGDVFDHPKEVYEYFSDKRIQSLDDFNKMQIINPPGQSGIFGSKYYDDSIAPWLNGKYYNLYWDVLLNRYV